MPGLGRSPGERKGYPLQYSGLENSMDRIVHGIAKSWTWLSDFHFSRTNHDFSNNWSQMASTWLITDSLPNFWPCLQFKTNYRKPNMHPSDQIRSDQSLSRVLLFATPWIAARQASLSITNSRSSPRLTSIESETPSSHLILCCPLLLLPPIPPSIRVFSSESALLMRWPKLLYQKLFLYFTVDGYLVSLQLGPFLNKAAIQIFTRHSVNICLCGTLGSWLGVFSFSRYCQTVLQGDWIHLLSHRQYNLIEF